MWKFDEKEGWQAAHSSSNGSHGTLVGGAKWRPDGRTAGRAIEQGGDGHYVAIDKDKESRFDNTDRLTVAACIKVNKFDKKCQAIVIKGDTSWRIARDKDRDCVQFAFNSVPREQSLKGRIKVDDGQWHHVAGVYDGQTTYVYVDGRLDLSAPTTTDIPTHNEPVLIGKKLPGEWLVLERADRRRAGVQSGPDGGGDRGSSPDREKSRPGGTIGRNARRTRGQSSLSPGAWPPPRSQPLEIHPRGVKKHDGKAVLRDPRSVKKAKSY